MTLETKFNVGDVVCLDLGLIREGGTRGFVMTINVAVDALRQYITYTVNYEGKTITVPESMLSFVKPVIYENLEEED
jgi:methionine aminopeptidase